VGPARRLRVDWTSPLNKPITPKFIGTKSWTDFPLTEVLNYIDWNPFFQASTRFLRPPRLRSGLLCNNPESRGRPG